jgi:hypothetical protein
VNELVQQDAELIQWRKMLVVSLFAVICPVTAMKGRKRERNFYWAAGVENFLI